MDLISCIITTYKRPISILKRAIDSIVSQTYKNIELILVNDGSIDSTADIIKSYETKFYKKGISLIYIYQEKDLKFLLFPFICWL